MRRWSLIMALVVLAITIQSWRIALQSKRVAPVRELHMVEVVSKDADRVYTVHVPASANPGKTDQQPTIRLCGDGDDLPLKAGMVLRVFQYKQESDCLRIDQDTWVAYLRDSHNNVIDKFGHQLWR